MQAIREFGDFSKTDAYSRIMGLSPYHVPLDALVAQQSRPKTDLMICCEEDYPLKYHSRKLVAKLRESYA
jgi:protease II